jgi:hypothetical protein
VKWQTTAARTRLPGLPGLDGGIIRTIVKVDLVYRPMLRGDSVRCWTGCCANSYLNSGVLMLRWIQLVVVPLACLVTTGCCCGPVPPSHCGAPAVGAHLAGVLNSPLFCAPCGYPPCHAPPPCFPAGYDTPMASCGVSPYFGGMPGDFPAGCGEGWHPGGVIAPYSPGVNGFPDNAWQGVDESVPQSVPPETPVPDPIGLPEAFDDASAFDTRGIRRTGHSGRVLIPDGAAGPVALPWRHVSRQNLRPAASRQQGIPQLPLPVVPRASY